ncbi:hypothetical protein TSAR_003627 [Trichomalopsis sarcophagae]|uniref:Uncharacterized protein n=1 Tax=Trichomalopsis sarcophagae TaxID=543379 RepID=A0A232EN99_9HYME|nr:hypothetical protein TSAR_003627 [Trichomalopsis sarcophagae]
MAESAGSPGATSVAANSPQQQQQTVAQPTTPQQQQQTTQTQQPPDISSSQLASPPITGTGITLPASFSFVASQKTLSPPTEPCVCVCIQRA